MCTTTLETAAADDIVLTFSRDITATEAVAIGGAGSGGKTISGIVIVANVVTVTVDIAYVAAEVVTITGLFKHGSIVSIQLTDESVTNNIV